MTGTTLSPSRGLTGWHVLAMVVGFFAVVIAVDVLFAVQAYKTFPGEVSVTPYEDGIAYNRTLAQLATQEKYGWKAVAGAEPGRIVVEFQNAKGDPVRSLSFITKLEHPATETGRLTPKFRETSPGRYEAEMTGIHGAWDLTLVAENAAGQRFEAERRLTWP
ncbi:MAG: ferredoxin [Phenylobacterium zucineum]|nr:MAG: ferredoxin [Phenylobacterium zucineum]